MKIIFATANTEKLKEAEVALNKLGFQVEGVNFNFVEPAEGTMEEIAKIKLSQINIVGNTPIFVDDSGIFFEAYHNFPGILTKRFFKLIGYKGVAKLLNDENRKAYFHGVIALKWKDKVEVFHGRTDGRIIENIPHDLPSDLKFPFDPIFLPENADKVLAKMDIPERLQYSYRMQALENMGEWLKVNKKYV